MLLRGRRGRSTDPSRHAVRRWRVRLRVRVRVSAGVRVGVALRDGVSRGRRSRLLSVVPWLRLQGHLRPVAVPDVPGVSPALLRHHLRVEYLPLELHVLLAQRARHAEVVAREVRARVPVDVEFLAHSFAPVAGVEGKELEPRRGNAERAGDESLRDTLQAREATREDAQVAAEASIVAARARDVPRGQHLGVGADDEARTESRGGAQRAVHARGTTEPHAPLLRAGTADVRLVGAHVRHGVRRSARPVD